MVAAGELAPDAELQLAPPLDQFIPGTWKASATFGGAVRYDVAGLSGRSTGIRCGAWNRQ